MTTIHAYKTLGDSHGGTLAPEDFNLFLDGQLIEQGVDIEIEPGQHTISEEEVFGYVERATLCTDMATNEQVSQGGDIYVEEGQQISCEVVNDEIPPTIVIHKEVDGGPAYAEDFVMTLNGEPVAQDTVYEIMANEPTVVSEDDSIPGYVPTSVVCESDIIDSPNNDTALDTGALTVTPTLGENIYCVITNEEVGAGLTVVKEIDRGDGGDELVGDFELQVNGDPVASGELIPYEADVELLISETPVPGWVASNVHCVSSDPESANNIPASVDPDPAALATVILQPGESVVCTITNDDIAPTVTVNKVVIGGTKPASAFQMTVAGDPVAQGAVTATLANTSIEVSEVDDPDYLMSVDCADADTDAATGESADPRRGPECGVHRHQHAGDSQEHR